MPTPTYDPIASTTLASSASSVTFSSLDTIAAGYRDLVLVADITTALTNVGINIQLNGDTGFNYNFVRMVGNGSSASSSALSGNNAIPTYWTTGEKRKQIIFQALDYSQTDKHKSGLIRANNPETETFASAFRWANTSAVSSLVVYTSDGTNMDSGSVFSLYGVIA